MELAICKLMGCVRTGPVGKEGPDCKCGNDYLAIQIKHRASVPQWLLDSVQQSVGDAGVVQWPILILHEKGSSYTDSLVITPLKFFLENVNPRGD